MQIHTTARHCELDPEDKRFAEERIGKLTKFARDIQEARLIVTLEGFRHSAEITLKLKGHEMVSREEADGTRIAIDRAADRIEHQLRRLKEKRVDHHRAGRGADGRVVDGRTVDGRTPSPGVDGEAVADTDEPFEED